MQESYFISMVFSLLTLQALAIERTEGSNASNSFFKDSLLFLSGVVQSIIIVDIEGLVGNLESYTFDCDW